MVTSIIKKSMADSEKDPEVALPDLSLWDGLQDALKIGRESQKKRRTKSQIPPAPLAKVHPCEASGAPSVSAAIKVGIGGEREENEFRCESCGKSWARYGFFIRHVKKKHDMGEFIASVQKRGDAGAKSTCRFCHGEVAERDFFDHFWRRHVDHTHPLDGLKTCLICKKTLSGLEKLRWHLRVIHFGELHVEPSRYGADVSNALLH